MKSFREIPKDRWPKSDGKPPEKVYINDEFLVQVINEWDYIRLTINRIDIDFRWQNSPIWKDKITWDELQEIKDNLGYEKEWLVEIYPPKDKIVNVANMRHLWLLKETPEYGWKNDS